VAPVVVVTLGLPTGVPPESGVLVTVVVIVYWSFLPPTGVQIVAV